MPEIIDNQEWLEKRPLKIELNLSGDTTNQEWIGYELKLFNGASVITEIGGTLHDKDIETFLAALTKEHEKEDYFEPVEPDFFVNLKPNGDQVEIFWCIDEGMRRKEGYSTSGIGVRVVVDTAQINHFAQSLRNERDAVTGGKKYEF